MLAVVTLALGVNAQAGPKADALIDQGKWMAAADQAATEKDFITAAMAIHRLQECPNPGAPKGQVWNAKIAAQGAEYARAALAQNLNTQDKAEAYYNLGNLMGNQAADATSGTMGMDSVKQAISLGRESKAAYEQAMQLSPRDALIVATTAFFHGRGYARGGIVIGAKLSDARYLTSNAAQLFNQMPDQTKEQQTRKAWAALRIAESFESLNDKNMKPFFEAAIKLGDQTGGADGRCAANVARVHTGKTVTNF